MFLLSHDAKKLMTRWTTCLGLALMLALSLCAHPVWAGSYAVTDSGGTVTRVNEGSTLPPAAYGLNTNTSPHKWGYNFSTVAWGTAPGPNGTTVATSGSMQAQGAITATFTWQGGGYPGSGGGGYPGGGAVEDPPDAVVIAESCQAS